MINRRQIESILKVNGVAATSPDEEIRSVLLSARYNKDEVDTAIMVLRENGVTNKTRVDGLHRVFRTNDTLSPHEISSLLGIEVDVPEALDVENKSQTISGSQHVMVWILSTLSALCAVLLYMYLNKFGLFHPSVWP